MTLALNQNIIFYKINLCAWILLQCLILSSCGIVLVTTTASKLALLIREMAGPEKMPWVKMAYTLVAPADTNLREDRVRRN